MTYKNEKQLLGIIKFTPPIFIISISIIITLFLYLESQQELKKETINQSNRIPNIRTILPHEILLQYSTLVGSEEHEEISCMTY